ncbi:MAG: EpsG family protein [Bacteroidaceae bacterium]|nr:EpsG family protein [Bacteroidaceae bacterium]
MWLYLIIFAIPLFIYLKNKTNVYKNDLFLGLYMMLLACFVGFSDMLGGYDRYIYGDIFDAIAADIHLGYSIEEIDAMYFFEFGYSFINWLIGHITRNRYIFILIYTILIYINFYIAFKRHITNYPFAFIVFFGLIFFFTFTYLRQIYGVSLALLSIKYLIERQRWKFFLIMITVALIHKSGIMFAVMYFIPQKKYTRDFVFIILFICLALGLSGLTSSFYDVYIEVSDINAQDDYSSDGGARFAYIAEVLVFGVIIFYNYDIVGKNKDEIFFLNMAIVFCAILLLFVRSINGGRLTWYFIFGIICTMTNIIANSKGKRANVLRTTLIVLFFGLFYRILVGWGGSLSPYKTFFTPGHRDYDQIYIQYEYDNEYDEDKFKNLWAWE